MTKDILYPLRWLHGWLYEKKLKFLQRRKIRKQFCSEFAKNSKTVFLLMTPEHGNLGDHAIVKAENDILTACGINYMEVTSRKLSEMMSENNMDLFNGFPILITGGGNLGTLWMDVEELEREIIAKNPKSPIIILPNTVFYEDSEWGREELCKSVQIYNRHKHLTIYAREQTSYEFMRSIYKDVKLIPDMVLLIKEDDGFAERKGCLLCMRKDRERTLSDAQESIIYQQVGELFGSDVTVTDMVVSGWVPVAQREEVLQAKFDEFLGAELVVTDRLHGMIFCAITGTPCVVVNSKSPKVRGCYEWIKHLDYIRFAENPEDIIKEYHLIPKGQHHYDNSHLKHYYQILAEDIQNIWR